MRGAIAGALKKKLGLEVTSEKDEKRGQMIWNRKQQAEQRSESRPAKAASETKSPTGCSVMIRNRSSFGAFSAATAAGQAGIEAPPDPSARWPGRTLLVCKACFLRLLTGALTSSRRSSSGCRARDQAIIKPQSIEIFDSLISPSQGLFLGLLKKCGSFFVQLFDALDRCFVCHLKSFPICSTLDLPVGNGEPRPATKTTEPVRRYFIHLIMYIKPWLLL